MLYICYTREDALFATQLSEELAELGIDVWFDLNEIPARGDWTAAQNAALEACESLILVISPEALAREHIIREIDRVWHTDKPITLAVAKPSPWKDWLDGLPVADFVQDYQDGLNNLLLLLTTGDNRRVRPFVDLTEAFLRQADRATEDEEDASWLRRTIRRLF